MLSTSTIYDHKDAEGGVFGHRSIDVRNNIDDDRLIDRLSERVTER